MNSVCVCVWGGGGGGGGQVKRVKPWTTIEKKKQNKLIMVY